MNTQAYPLSWPAGWPRTKFYRVSSFADRSVDAATREVINQLRALGVGNWDVIVSTNLVLRNDGFPRSDQRAPLDPGVAVYFTLKNKPAVLACDRWGKVQENLWAIAKHIEALRGQQRWGVGSIDQAFAGYAALPAPASAAPWWEVLHCDRLATLEEVTTAYRGRARDAHPDNGGTHEQMAKINAAYAEAKKSLQ